MVILIWTFAILAIASSYLIGYNHVIYRAMAAVFSKCGIDAARTKSVDNEVNGEHEKHHEDAHRLHAPRNLSAPLLYRLNEIADGHGGTVPLHGRLFAQWMHHAFPRECPYPHESGTTNPQTPSEWMEENDEDHPTVSREEMRRLVEDASMFADAPSQGALEEAMPWSSTEELLAVQHGKILSAATTDTTAWSRLRGVALVAAVTSGLLGPAYAFFQAAGISATNEKKCLGKFV